MVFAQIVGSLNDDRDQDNFWSFSLSIPWEFITEGKPQCGDIWGYNFMRVDFDGNTPRHWAIKQTGKNKNIHVPKTWPTLRF